MPIYRYKCEVCDHELELIQSMKEGEEYQATVKECPKCTAPKWRRLISNTSFKLQGGGWFRDDYR